MIVQPVARFLKRFPGWDLRLAATDYRPTFKAGERASFSPWVQVNDDQEPVEIVSKAGTAYLEAYSREA